MPPESPFSAEAKPSRGLGQVAADQQAGALLDVPAFSVSSANIYIPEPKKSYLGEAVAFVANKTGIAAPDSELEKDIVYYTTSIMKAVPLFMKGKTAVVGTGLMFGFDQAKRTDEWDAQGLDFLGGATKGVALKGLFTLASCKKFNLSPFEKGLYIGTGSRAIDTLTNRYSYMDRHGDASLDALGQNFHKSVFNRDALVVDLVLFGAAGATHFGINRYTNQFLEKNPFANNVSTGATFGLFSGSLEEVENQRRKGGPMDYWAIAKRGLLRMTADGVSAIPGGFQGRAAALREAGKTASATTDPLRVSPVGVVEKSLTTKAGVAEASKPIVVPQEGAKPVAPPEGAKPVAPPEAGKPGVLPEVTRPGTPVEVTPPVAALTATAAEGFARLSQQIIVEPTTRMERFPGVDPAHPEPFLAVEKPAVVYKAVDASGKTIAEVVVEQSYAKELNEIRQLRLEISAAKTPAEKAKAIERLNERHLSDRMLPEDVLHHLQQVPGRPFTKVTLHNGPNPFDKVPSHGQFGVADVTVTGKGELTIFPSMSSHPAKAAVTHEGFLHEWTHELRSALPEHARLYDAVASREPANVRDYATATPEESFAVNLSEGLLNPSPEAALAFARSAPVKNLVLARAAIAGIEKISLLERTPADQKILERAKAIETDLLPRALDVLRVSQHYTADTIFDIAGREQGNRILTARTLLDVSNRGLNDSFFRSLMGVNQFVAVDMSGNKGITTATANIMQGWPNLQKVQAPGTGINDSGVNALSSLPLTELGLARTKIGDGALTNSLPMTSLERANFSGTNVGDAGIRKLEAATFMRWLMLEGTPITDASIPSLAKLKLLTDLNVHRTKMTPEGVRRLRELLPGTKITY